MKPLKIFTTVIASLLILLVPKKFASACGFWVAPGEYRFWLLQPDLTNQADLTPFFFASTYLYKGDINSAVDIYKDKNVDEWYAELRQQASKKDIREMMYNTPPHRYFNSEKDSKNSFMVALRKPENKDHYDYFRISKRVEEIGDQLDPWDESTINYSGIDFMINKADALYKQSKSSFIKLRSAYQLQRLYGFRMQHQKSLNVYESRIAPVKTDSWIKTAAMYKYAGQIGGIEGDYMYSKAFDRGDYNRSHCLMYFRSNRIDTVLMHAKNLHERTVIHAMKAMNYPGRTLSMIRKIYAMEPAYKNLNFLLLREINKIEDWLLTTKLTDFTIPSWYDSYAWMFNDEQYKMINYKSDKTYAAEFYIFLLQVITEGKQKDLSLLRLYASHLALVNGNAAASAKLLAEITDEKQLPANVRTQLQVNRFLLHLENGFDKNTENEFVHIINRSPEQLGVNDPEIMKNQLILYTARKLIKKGIKAKGLMLLGHTNRAIGDLSISGYKSVYQYIEEIATPEVYDQIIATLDKKNKTQFEKFITKAPRVYWYYDRYVRMSDAEKEQEEKDRKWDRTKIMDGKSSWYIRNYRLKDALAVLEQIPDSVWSVYPYSYYIKGNPFYLNVYKSHPVTVADKRDLNKKQVIKEMIRLENMIAKNDPRSAECYFQLANAWYNMTWYGKNWLMVHQWWSTGDYPSEKNAFNDDYHGCNRAKAYYLLALQKTKDKNLASLACFMAGVCENNSRKYINSVYEKDIDYYNYAEKNPYKKRLSQKGMSEKIYNELVSECALYLDFIGRYNKVL